MARPQIKVTCVLWYKSMLGASMVGWFESDYEAADYAVNMQRHGSGGVPIGCQHPDGEILLLADWEEYADAVERADEAQELAQNPPPPTKTVIDPFDGSPVTVDRKTPNWVGAQPGDPMFPITPL